MQSFPPRGRRARPFQCRQLVLAEPSRAKLSRSGVARIELVVAELNHLRRGSHQLLAIFRGRILRFAFHQKLSGHFLQPNFTDHFLVPSLLVFTQLAQVLATRQ